MMTRAALGILLAVGVAACVPPVARPASETVQAATLRSKSAWQNEVLYFIVTDRFANGNRRNDRDVEPANPTGYHGGDLDGVIGKLDYLKDLGVTTLWLTPWVDNDDQVLAVDGKRLWGYHGYWPKDLKQVDEHLGDLATVRRLVNEAHRRGLQVMQDYVVNHTGYQHPWGKARKDPASPYHGWFHQFGDIRNWDDPWQMVHGDLHGLPDWRHANPETARYLIDDAKWWVQQTGVDGLRLDAVKHVDRDFWRRFNREVRTVKPDLMLLGEVLHGDVGVCADYMRDGFDSLFDFPLYYGITDVFARGQSARRLAGLLAQDDKYPANSFLTNFIDNHDVPRFLSVAGDRGVERLQAALSFIFTIRGMPSLYYGTEAGLKGGDDPYNRPDMDWQRGEPRLKGHIQRLAEIRRRLSPLRQGRQLEMWQDDQVFAFSRLEGTQEVIVIHNTSEQPITRRMPLRAESRLADGTRLVDHLSNQATVVSERSLTVTIPPLQARILAPELAAGASRR